MDQQTFAMHNYIVFYVFLCDGSNFMTEADDDITLEAVLNFKFVSLENLRHLYWTVHMQIIEH
jgi:hypothetical protein